MNAQEIQGWVDAAVYAFKGASTLDELKSARLSHTGDKSPISGASRSLGSLSPEEKISLGKLV
jgi:phenylalanyl-tRNA synthetase alpha chain